MRRDSHGQTLPMFVLLLFTLLLGFAGYGYRSWAGIQKIEHQTTSDLLALQIANDQARALNEIAALNEGLRIILRRAYLYAGTLTFLAGCSGLLNPSCARAFFKLSSKAPTFFRNVNRLGKRFGDWQDALIQWAEKSPERTTLFFNITHSPQLAIPSPARLTLPLQRLGKNDLLKMGTSSEESVFSSGGDLLRCRETDFDRSQYTELRKFAETMQLRDKDQVKVIYVAENDASRIHTENRLPTAPSPKVHIHGEKWLYDHALLTRCESFQDVLNSLNHSIPLPIQIPAPYGLTKKLSESPFSTIRVLSKNRSTDEQDVAKSLDLFANGESPLKNSPFQSLSTSRLMGGDLDEMEFSPTLTGSVENNFKLTE